MSELDELQSLARDAIAAGDEALATRAMDKIEALQASSGAKSPSIFNRAVNAVGGAVEPLLKVATGAIAKPIGEIAGMAAIPLHAAGLTQADPEQVRQRTQQGLTYQPKTQLGESPTNLINRGLSAIGTGFGYVGEKTRSGMESLGAPEWAKSGAQETVNQAIGLGMVKGMPEIGRNIKTTNDSILAKLAEQKASSAGRDAIKTESMRLKLITSADRGPKAAIEKSTGADFQISLKNQRTATDLLAEEVGLRKGSISDGAIDARRLELNKPYDAVQAALKGGVKITPEFATGVQSKLADLSKRYNFDKKTNAGLKPTIELLEQQMRIVAKGKVIDSDLVMSQIRELRSSANTINKSASQTPSG